MNYLRKKGLVAFSLVVMVGCSSQPPAKHEPIPKPNKDKSLNQPDIAKLEPVTNGSFTAADYEPSKQNIGASKSASFGITSGSLIAGGSKQEGDKKDTAPNKPVASPKPEKAKVNNATSKSTVTVPVNDEVSSFFIYEGETYKSALFRWLNAEGYTKVGTLLADNQERLLDVEVKESKVIESSFQEALDELVATAKSEKVLNKREKELTEEEKSKLYIDIRLDDVKNEAIVTSSKLPTTMFVVEKGSLLENYLKLGRTYGWDAREEFFLATNMTVEFSYPIVTEKGNVKDALGQLLSRFKDYRGALVPSFRQVYVMKEEQI